MHLIFVFGPPAVGKMTVGQSLAKLTGYKLFHNHMSIELVCQLFDFGTKEFRNLDDTIRFAVFKEVAKSDMKGLIFTMVWDHDDPEDKVYIDKIAEEFRSSQISYVELYADMETRLKRNKTPNRLEHKASKRDLDASDKRLHIHEQDHRMISKAHEYPLLDMLRINTVNLSADETAEVIKKQFKI